MCGIAGIWAKEEKSIDTLWMPAMLNALKNRGPDAEGIWQNQSISLGNRRLKILDLSDRANQPFSDGKDVLVFNGRIFNFQELRKDLSEYFEFQTTGDTEVLFRSLQKWGLSCLNRLEGQFAFSFFNHRLNQLWIARDPVGVCPLYYFDSDSYFIFSSEIKPILNLQPAVLNPQGLIDFLGFRYNIQNGNTLFKNVKRFNPAHSMVINLNTRSVDYKRYWRLNFQERVRSSLETQEELNHLLDTEIKRQRQADVPVGIYLSGGIDSGALLKGFNQSDSPLLSYTLSFFDHDPDSTRVDELSHSFGFKKNIISFEESNLDILPEVVKALEDPFGDLIICANYLLAQRASRDVKVVLSGEGGDEAFCGYDHQKSFFKLLQLKNFPGSGWAISQLLNLISPQVFARLQSYPGNFGLTEMTHLRGVTRALPDVGKSYSELVKLFSEFELKNMLNHDFRMTFGYTPDVQPIREIFQMHEDFPWRAVMQSEIEQLTLIVNLTKQDRFGMHFGVEGCVPFVSKAILEFAASLTFAEHNSKINKRLLLNYSGHPVVKKRPFSLFSNDVYRKKLEKMYQVQVLEKRNLGSRIFNDQALKQIGEDLRGGGLLAIKKAMLLLVLYTWLEVFNPKLEF